MKNHDTSEKAANTAILSIGSNLGNRIYNLEKTKYLILKQKIKILNSSSFYETLSWPNPKFPKFLNIILKIKTNLSLKKLFLFLKLLEKKMGRKPSKKNYPRVCDIDIIDFNRKSYIIKDKINEVYIPHPRMKTRNFVLFPLYEIDKNWKHAKSRENISKLLSKLPINSIRGIKVIN